MIFWGKTGCTFGDQPFTENCYIGNNFKSLRLSNQIIDCINIEENIDLDSSDMIKPEFGMNTALLADFKNNLEGGNFSNNGIKIQYIRFKRRKIGELKWQNMIDIPFDINVENYDLNDYFVSNVTNYEYALVPITQSTEGIGLSNTIMSKYFSLFLTGRSEDGKLKNYPLKFDLQLSDISINEDKVIQKTLSSKFPAFLQGESKYYSGTITGDLISPTTQDNFGKIDMQAENVYREGFEEFLHYGKPMLIRNHSMYFLGITSDIKKNPIFQDDCAWGIWTYNFTFTEVNIATDLDILKANLLTYDITTS